MIQIKICFLLVSFVAVYPWVFNYQNSEGSARSFEDKEPNFGKNIAKIRTPPDNDYLESHTMHDDFQKLFDNQNSEGSARFVENKGPNIGKNIAKIHTPPHNDYLEPHTMQKPVQSETCNIVVEDELWPYEWYLNKSEGDKYDMNVLPAWRSCINGTGITVGVVDKGVHNHVDLKINRRVSFGDVNDGTVRSLQHGTRVAGLIGAMKNKNFTIGIAFGSEIADLKIATSSVFDTFDEAALIHNKDIIDVYSCSFSNFHTGVHTYKLEQNQSAAFIEGTTKGRRGLGSVYVFATGNSGDVTDFGHDSCVYDRLVTNRFVISVAGIQNDLSKVPNGEACSAMLVAAFTAKGGATHHKIVTTDVRNTSTFYFNQNSAAAPMVSGAVALALSAKCAIAKMTTAKYSYGFERTNQELLLT